MTLSIWRYAHLILALFSFLLLAMLSFTGIVLAVDAIDEKVHSFEVSGAGNLTVAEVITNLKKTYPEIIEIDIDHNSGVLIQATDANDKEVNAFVDPFTGKILGKPKAKNEFVQWNLALHRSIFLKETGRIIVGITSFLLILISISGIALVIQRQQGMRRFFTKIVREYFAQYYHVFLGRLSLIPILILAITGTFLSLVQFDIFGNENSDSKAITVLQDQKKILFKDFPVFKSTRLEEVKKISFPFIEEDEEEHFVLKLTSKELTISQISGVIIGEIQSGANWWSDISMDLHTGRTSIIWAIVLILASANILFFIYSGFTISLKRKKTKIRNKYKAAESQFILLFASENGSTLRFANAIHHQLLAAGVKSFLGEANNYTFYPAAEHMLFFASTYGLGSPPSNASGLLSKIKTIPQNQKIKTSVIGFGSRAYPDFCRFAEDVDSHLKMTNWSEQFLPMYTIEDQSAEQFIQWMQLFKERSNLSFVASPALFSSRPRGLKNMLVIEKSEIASGEHTFRIKLRPQGRNRFVSGDLIAFYPANDHRERFYSISRNKSDIELLVKFHPSGLASEYLNKLKPGELIKARIVENNSFHFPKTKKKVALIANGTGIAPFLGMLNNNKSKSETILFAGFRKQTDLIKTFEKQLIKNILESKLSRYHIAFSQEGNRCHVMDLIRNETANFAEILLSGGIIMICGSLAMQRDVEAVIEEICTDYNLSDLAYYKGNGQVLGDCY